MHKLIDDFNVFFAGSATATITDAGRLEIAIGAKTLVLSLPEVVAGWSKGQS